MLKRNATKSKFRLYHNDTQTALGVVFSCIDEHTNISHALNCLWGNDYAHAKGSYVLQKETVDGWVDTEYKKTGRK